jgi:hypothetical protein
MHDPNSPFEAIQILPSDQWESQRRMSVTQEVGDFAAYAYFMPRFGCEAFKRMKLFSGKNFLLAFGRKPSEGGEPWVCVVSYMQDADLFAALGDARKMAVALSKKKDKRMILLQDDLLNVTKSMHVSLETAKDGPQVTYYIDLKIKNAHN